MKFAAGLTRVLIWWRICSFFALLSVHHKKGIISQGTRISSICGLSHFSSCRRSCACGASTLCYNIPGRGSKANIDVCIQTESCWTSTRKGVNPEKMLRYCHINKVRWITFLDKSKDKRRSTRSSLWAAIRCLMGEGTAVRIQNYNNKRTFLRRQSSATATCTAAGMVWDGKVNRF